jgi:hypothetical protein
MKLVEFKNLQFNIKSQTESTEKASAKSSAKSREKASATSSRSSSRLSTPTSVTKSSDTVSSNVIECLQNLSGYITQEGVLNCDISKSEITPVELELSNIQDETVINDINQKLALLTKIIINDILLNDSYSIGNLINLTNQKISEITVATDVEKQLNDINDKIETTKTEQKILTRVGPAPVGKTVSLKGGIRSVSYKPTDIDLTEETDLKNINQDELNLFYENSYKCNVGNYLKSFIKKIKSIYKCTDKIIIINIGIKIKIVTEIQPLL